MEKIGSKQDFYNIIKEERKIRNADINNNYLTDDRIDDMVEKGVLFYEIKDDGLLFFDDERDYYNLYYYWNSEKPFCTEKREKPVVIVNYWNGEKREKQLKFEERLKEAGFENTHLSQQIKKNVEGLKKVVDETYAISKKFFDSYGLKLIPPEEKHVESFRELLRSLKEIPVWHVPYQNDEEIVESGRRGNTVCAVDKNDRVCAAISYFFDDATYGWVGIAPDYQKKPGIPVVLYEWSYRRILERNPNLNGWIADINKKSANFHVAMGFTWTGRHKEDWVLQ